MKNIVILGSTGSIGKNALNVVSAFPHRFRVVGLTAGGNVRLLMDQINLFSPEVVAVSDKASYEELRDLLAGRRLPEILYGAEGISSVAEMPGADVIISAIVGSAGLIPTIAAVRAGKTIGLANKETLVMAGDIVMSEAVRCGAVLLPVDSEHSAVFQCIRGYERESLKRIILTASGGPFFGKTKIDLKDVRPEDALKHPNWSMGPKISIDSATLMNKGLEVIEAHHLFAFPPSEIDVLIHPQSIIHSIVEFKDGSCLAQLSRPDMRGPIAYAMAYPERLDDVMESLDWERLSGLTFRKPDVDTFPCLGFAYSAIQAGGTMPAVLNAANEVVVKAFLDGIAGFNDIPAIINNVMDCHTARPADDISVILDADRWAREKTYKELHK